MTEEEFERVDLQERIPYWKCVDDGGVSNCTTRINKLTCLKLLVTDDWGDWEASKFEQLKQ